MNQTYIKIEGIQYAIKSLPVPNHKIIDFFSNIEIDNIDTPYKEYRYDFRNLYDCHLILSEDEHDFINGFDISFLASRKNKKKIYNILKKYKQYNIIKSVTCKKIYYYMYIIRNNNHEKMYVIKNITNLNSIYLSKYKIYKCKSAVVKKSDKHNTNKNPKLITSGKKAIYMIKINASMSKESNIIKNSPIKKKYMLKLLKEIQNNYKKTLPSVKDRIIGDEILTYNKIISFYNMGIHITDISNDIYKFKDLLNCVNKLKINVDHESNNNVKKFIVSYKKSIHISYVYLLLLRDELKFKYWINNEIHDYINECKKLIYEKIKYESVIFSMIIYGDVFLNYIKKLEINEYYERVYNNIKDLIRIKNSLNLPYDYEMKHFK